MMELDSEDEAPGAVEVPDAVEVPALPARRGAAKVKAKAAAAAEVAGEVAATDADPAGPPVQNPGDPEVRGFGPKRVFLGNGATLTACLGSHACSGGMLSWEVMVARLTACLEGMLA